MRDPSLHRPLVLGHEAAGVVTQVGNNVSHLSEGDHALVTWVKAIADSGVPNPVPSGLTRRGETVQRLIVYSWSEHVLADAGYVVAMPKEYPTDVTSIVGCAVLTGVGAVLNTAGVRPGDSVAVFGVGGVGLSAIRTAASPYTSGYIGEAWAPPIPTETCFAMFLRWYRDGKFPLDKLVTRRYSLEQINEACDALWAGDIFGRAIIEY